MKELIEKLREIIAEKLKNREFEITSLERSSVEGYVDCKFTIEGYKFFAAFNKKGFICWHDYPTFGEPELTEEETKSLCDEIHEKWNAIYKERLADEIRRKQLELETL